MILIPAECRVHLNLASTITDIERAAIEMLIPMAQGAVRSELHYDPEQAERTEWYPKVEQKSAAGGTYLDVNDAGTMAFAVSTGRSATLQLARLPVRSIAEIKVDYNGGFGQKSGTFGSDTVLTAGEDYYLELDQAGLSMTGNVIAQTGWPVEPGTVKVTYTAGYSADEFAGRSSGTGIDASPIKLATILTLVKAFKTWKTNARQSASGFNPGIVTSERLGAYSYSVDASVASSLAGMKVSVPAEGIDLLQPFKHYGLMLL